MSRIAKKPILIPNDVKIKINLPLIEIEGRNGIINYKIPKLVNIKHINNKLIFKIQDINLKKNNHWSLAGTTRSIVSSMIIGVNNFFIKKLNLVGVGYRAIINNKNIFLYLGFSHEIKMSIPEDIFIECNNNEIIIKGINKQKVSQIAANLCSFRCLDPYKGKGIRDTEVIIRLKETKKK